MSLAEALPTGHGSRSRTATTVRIRFGVCPEGAGFVPEWQGRRKRVHQADEHAATIAAERVWAFGSAGFVVLTKPPLGGHSAVGRGFEGPNPGPKAEVPGVLAKAGLAPIVLSNAPRQFFLGLAI